MSRGPCVLLTLREQWFQLLLIPRGLPSTALAPRASSFRSWDVCLPGWTD